jgi:hypothetical protein
MQQGFGFDEAEGDKRLRQDDPYGVCRFTQEMFFGDM